MFRLARVVLTVVAVSGMSFFFVASTAADACAGNACACSLRLCPGGDAPCHLCPTCGFEFPVVE